MICQFAWRVNTPEEDFFKIPLNELYERILNAVHSRRSRFFLPSRGRYCEADDYILNGGYKRKRIIDIQMVRNEDSTYRYEEVEIRDFRVQRILEKGAGHTTHAILPEIFVPYKQYSLRYILFHLREYFRKPISQETYCLDAGIEIKTFRLWLKWIRDHIIVLAELGLTQNRRDNWETMRQWIQELTVDLFEWTARSLRKLNLGLFQEHPMPENTTYRNYARSG